MEKLSWNTIRNYAERWTWIGYDGRRHIGTDVPQGAINPQRVAYHIKYITQKGTVEDGKVVTLKVFPECRQRMIQFVTSKEIRRVRDYLIIEIDGHQFMTH